MVIEHLSLGFSTVLSDTDPIMNSVRPNSATSSPIWNFRDTGIAPVEKLSHVSTTSFSL